MMRIADNPELVQILKKKEKEEKVGRRKSSGGAAVVGGGGGSINGSSTMSRGALNSTAPAAIVLPTGPPPSKWKQQSMAFRQAMRAAREYPADSKGSGGNKAPPPHVPSAPDPSLVLCPHCGRRFSEKSAERHIPQCQNIRAKPSTLRKGGGGGGGIQGSATKQPPSRR